VLAATNIQITIDDVSDIIPLVFAQTQHGASVGAKPWAEVSLDDARKRCSKAKKKLCCESAGKMTLELLLGARSWAGDPNLLQRIAQIVGAGS